MSQWSHLASWIFIDIASDDGWLPVWRQAISWTNNDFQQSDLIKEIKWNLRWIRKFPYSSMHLNILTVKCHPLRLNLNGYKSVLANQNPQELPRGWVNPLWHGNAIWHKISPLLNCYHLMLKPWPMAQIHFYGLYNSFSQSILWYIPWYSEFHFFC